MKLRKLITALSLLVLSAMSIQAHADRRVGGGELFVFSPYLYGQDYKFDGGAEANTKSHAGFGLGMGYNFSSQLTLTADVSWNSFNYDGTRVNDDASTQSFRGGMDTWNVRFGSDYYFGTGKLAPFVNANFGWNFVDTNIPDAPPGAVCWWDPWWGYVCRGYQSTHTENSLFYGAGLGLRLDLGRNNFVKLGYYNEWTDYDASSNSPTMDMLRMEFGWAF